jgi:cell division protein FtsW
MSFLSELKPTLRHPIFLSAVALIGLGLVQVYSSSYVFALERFENAHYFFLRQLFFAFIALVSMLFVSSMSPRWFDRMATGLFYLSVFFLVLTLLPGVGIQVGGAKRWLPGPLGFRIEPSEFLKISYPIYLAKVFSGIKDEIHFPHWTEWVLLAAPLGLLLLQPDFGSFVVLTVVGISFLFIRGIKKRSLVTLAALALPILVFLVVKSDYRMARVLGFLDPWADPERKGFQLIQSMLSVSSGGWFGAGLGEGQGKLFFLPEAHTDFTLAVFAEENGFLGMLFLFGFFTYLLTQIFSSAIHHDMGAKKQLQVVGLGVVLSLGILINMGVVLGMLPTKGITLPFLSYGGSSLVAHAILIGMILNRTKQKTLAH